MENACQKGEEDVIETTYDGMTAITDHSTVSDTTDGIPRILNRGIEASRLDLDEKMSQILDPFCIVHPIDYNRYLVGKYTV